ncbi:MAG: hypothetical protein ABJG78_12395 [Cyclobacteriaceae bacterium]
MLYNIYVQTQTLQYNMLALEKENLMEAVNAYLEGEESYTIAGDTRFFNGVFKFKIYTLKMKKDRFIKAVSTKGDFIRTTQGDVIKPKILAKVGDDVTEEFLGNQGYGSLKDEEATVEVEEDAVYATAYTEFVDSSRIKELEDLESSDYDLSRLVQFLRELNDNYSRGNYFSVGVLGRTILNHVPPIFGLGTFEEVAAQYGGKSFKGVARSLRDHRHIAEDYLHQTIRKKEVLPNKKQVDFQGQLDFILAEIISVISTTK